MKNKKVLITGSSGFIGFHVVENLLKNNYHIVGIDNHNNYYDPKLKNVRKHVVFSDFALFLLEFTCFFTVFPHEIQKKIQK